MLAVNGISTTYSQCSQLEPTSSFDLYYTLQNPGATTTLQVAISAMATGWIGVGFPQQGQEMVGTDSVIIKTAAGTATGKPLHVSKQVYAAVVHHICL